MVPADIQDSETRTINWLLQMDDASDGVTAASQPDCSHVVAGGSPPSETEAAVVLLADFSVHAAQLPSTKPPAECIEFQNALSLPLADKAHQVSEHATDTQLDALTVDHVVCAQPPPVCTRLGRPVKPTARLICEMNEQVVDDSVLAADSLFPFVRNMFSG